MHSDRRSTNTQWLERLKNNHDNEQLNDNSIPVEQHVSLPVPDMEIAEPPANGHSTNGHQAGLTGRKMEVLRLLVDGLSYGQIANALVISSRTVDAHLRSIYSKLQVRSRHEAARYALEHHLIEFHERRFASS